MSRCFIWFHFGWFFRRTQVISEFGGFYKNWGFYLEGVWLCRISEVYSTHPRPRRYCFRIWSKTTPQRLPVVTEVFEIQVVPSSDVWIVPSLLTLTSNPLEVVVEVLSLFAHEMIVKQKQKIRKTCKICFIFFPISKVKYYWIVY